MIKGIILDLDGLISDTERLHMKAYQLAFKDINYDLTDSFYCQSWIQKGLGISDVLTLLDLDYDPEEIRSIKKIHYDKFLRSDLHPMPYAIDFIKHFYKKIPMAVASAALGDDVAFVLEALNIMDYMEFFLSADHVKHRKPHPEVWDQAAKKLNLKPTECIALEDAEKGIIACNKIKMPVIAIPNIYTKDNDFSTADYLVGDLKEAKELIDSLLNS